MALATGTRLGSYEVLAPLGAGGMGEVYRARDSRLGRDVALKILPEAFARDAARLARFEREARMVATLNHPGIVTLFSIEADAGTRFLTMELVEGRTLDQLIVAGGMPLGRVLEITVALADALAAAHAKAVVHRDLKPANVMVTPEGRVKVLDFGLAKAAHESTPGDETQIMSGAPLSGVGVVVGTVPYMAPEQVRGGAVDARTDVFALGIILYELASGRRPFAGGTFADMSSAILRDAPPHLTSIRGDLPRELERIVSRCLEKQPEDRFQTAAEVVRELRLLEQRHGRGAPGPSAAEMPSIAVLPFTNMSADPENEYFSDGLSEELLNVLAKIPELKVTGRTSSFAFKGKQEDLRDIGQKLGVATLLEGSVRKAGNRVRITAQLIKVADGFHVWSESYDRVLDDIFSVQDDIARAVSSALQVTLLGKPSGKTRNAATYEKILRADHFRLKNDGPSLAKAMSLYQAAIDDDPTHARAWAGLAKAHAEAAFYGHGDTGDNYRLAREAAERAITLDDGDADAHLVMGWILGSMDFRWKESMDAVQRAVSLAPGASEPLLTLGLYRTMLGRIEEGRDLARKAVDIDPINPNARLHLGRIEGWAGNLVASCDSFQRALELSPEIVSVHALSGLLYVTLGRMDDAIAEIEEEPSAGYRDHALAIAYHVMGSHEASDAALARLVGGGEQWGFQIASAHAVRGEIDEAFQWLDRSYELHDSGVVSTRVHLWFDNLHADPRWPRFLKKVGLTDD